MLLSTEEYARSHDMDERAVRRLCESGKIKSLKLGKVWLIQGDLGKTSRDILRQKGRTA